MYEMNRAHQGRVAIRTFHVVAHAVLLRGRYSLGGQSGQALESALKTLSPEIYGSMNDPMRIELKGLEYIMDRPPKGVIECQNRLSTKIYAQGVEHVLNFVLKYSQWEMTKRRMS